MGDQEDATLYSECLTIAVEICSNTNDGLKTRSIKNFPKTKEINQFGVLIKRGLMKKRTGFGSQILNKLRKNSFYTVNSHLFLFKKCLIVCYEETIAELNKDVSFSYNDIFWITKMNIRADKATEFILTDPDRALKMVFDAFTQENLRSWVATISQEINRAVTSERRNRKLNKVYGISYSYLHSIRALYQSLHVK